MKPLPEDVMVNRWRDRVASIAGSLDATEALSFVRQLDAVAAKVEMRLVSATEERHESSAPITLAAKYAGTCKVCQTPFNEGARIKYRRGYGAFCLGCKP